MIVPKNLEELATYVEKGKHIFFFTADWCGDCRFIYPILPKIETHFPAWQFVRVDRDNYLDVAIQWDIFGIPSFVAIENGEEQGRLVSKNRKTKEEIIAFLQELPK